MWIVDDDLWALIEPLLPPSPEKAPGPRPVPDRLCLQGILYVLHNDIAWQLLPLEMRFGGDKGYDSDPNRRELRERRILPVISRRGAPNLEGLSKLRYVVEQTFALLHRFERLVVRWERRTELHNAFASLACSLICWRRLKKARS
ncbi:transposase [Streptomyces sp. SM11]|uniref:transposase n=1 Tax=Streptomyces sp. SM11 TaxID=565557 RepID=UPI000CD4CB39|nr:transposase [Streptomyces sp. SM11]